MPISEPPSRLPQQVAGGGVIEALAGPIGASAPAELNRTNDGPLYEKVAEQLRSRIVAHRLAPGSWIDEQTLAAEYGISRTPMREALKVLAAEGLVTMKPRRGAYVSEVSERDLSEVYHLLALLESDAAMDVAQHAGGAQLQRLQALHDELEASAGDRDRFFAANEHFHMQLLECAGNRWRLQLVLDLRKVMKLNRHHSLSREGRIDASLDEHRQLMQALHAHDAARVQALMQLHFANGKAAASVR